MSGSEVDAGLEFGVGGDESTCVGELGRSMLVESARSVELPGSCALMQVRAWDFCCGSAFSKKKRPIVTCRLPLDLCHRWHIKV